jgi:small conductance mechanosensitive channel
LHRFRVHSSYQNDVAQCAAGKLVQLLLPSKTKAVAETAAFFENGFELGAIFMRHSGHPSSVIFCSVYAGLLTVVSGGTLVQAQIPGLPASGPPVGASAEPPKKTVVTSEGPIRVKENMSDRTIQQFLAKFLPKYPGVISVKVAVDDGVVSLDGRVDDDDSRDEITGVVSRVEGVRVVMNRMNTDEDVMTAWQFGAREAGAVAHYLGRKWLLIVLAFLVIAVSALVARMFADHSETLLSPFVSNTLLRSVAGSLISTFVVLGGLLLALAALRLTHVVLSILGLSAVVGLAVGFAFRDITENFIASVLLGLRRPFQIGDYVTVSGQSGVVKSLNTRATVLVTLEGNHVRIPNSVIFKEIMVNATASPSFRNSFDVVIPYEASTGAAIDAISGALRGLKGALAEPPPRTLVEALEPGGVRLRAYFWTPTQGVDWFQLMSDAKLKTKVALQSSGIIASSATGSTAPGGVSANPGKNAAEPLAVTPEQAHANLIRDTRKAAATNDARQAAPLKHALEQPETRVSEEGTNLLEQHAAG